MTVTDSRRAPFCYQTHAALDAIREHLPHTRRSTGLAVYLALTETANRSGGAEARNGFVATRREIALRAGVSTDTLDRYIPELVEAGVLDVERERVGEVNLPNLWTLVEPPPGAPPSRTDAATPSRASAATPSRTDAAPRAVRSRPRSKDLEVAPTALPGLTTVRDLVGEFVDAARSKGVDPPKRTVGHLAKEIASLVAEGRSQDEIRRGLARMLERRFIAPGALPNLIVEAALPQTRRTPGGNLTAEQMIERAHRLAEAGE